MTVANPRRLKTIHVVGSWRLNRALESSTAPSSQLAEGHFGSSGGQSARRIHEEAVVKIGSKTSTGDVTARGFGEVEPYCSLGEFLIGGIVILRYWFPATVSLNMRLGQVAVGHTAV